MRTTCNAENLFSLPKNKLQQATILEDDPFLAYFTEKYIKEHLQSNKNTHVVKHSYQAKNHLSIKAALLSRDMFSEQQAHILVVKGTELKHEPLIKLIQETQDNAILFIIQKLAPAQKKTKGFLILSKQTTVISTKALSEKKTITWLQGLLKNHQRQIPPRLIEPLCQHLDWDLSSMAQLVKQMEQHNIKKINNLSELTPCILTTHQAPIFTLIDKLFNGDTTYCHRFFTQHQQTDVIQKIFWICLRRIKQYILMQEKMRTQNCSMQHIMTQERIWPQLQTQYQKALKIPQTTLQNCFLTLCKSEWAMKGVIKQDFIQETIHTLMKLCYRLQKKAQYQTNT